MNDRILITGGAGFIGANLARHHLAAGKRVTIFDNFSSRGSERNGQWLASQFPDTLQVIRGDLRQPSIELARAVDEVGVVYHLAGQVAVSLSVSDPRLDFDSNATGTFNVLEAVRLSAAKPVLVYSSTNKVYGALRGVAVEEQPTRYRFRDITGVDENHPVEFHSPYGCSKGAADSYVLDYARIYGMKTVVFRQSCIYGPRQFGTEDQGWLAWFTLRALANEPVTLFGNGKQMRDILFIDDLIDAYSAAVARIDVTCGEAYNIGGGPANTLSLLELIVLIEKRTGRRFSHSHSDWRPGDQMVFVSNIEKARRDFGWTPRVDPSTGVSILFDWMSEHSA